MMMKILMYSTPEGGHDMLYNKRKRPIRDPNSPLNRLHDLATLSAPSYIPLGRLRGGASVHAYLHYIMTATVGAHDTPQASPYG